MNGYALLIGVNRVEKKHYGFDHTINIEANLKAVEFMLDQCNSVTGENLYPNRERLQTDVTWAKVTTALKEYQKLTNGFLVIYLLCHGTRIDLIDDIDTTLDNRKNFFCFSDQMVFENEWKAELSKFKKGFNVLGIIETCYSEGIKRIKGVKPFPQVYREKYAEGFYQHLAENFPNNYISNFDKADICMFFSSSKDTTSKPPPIDGEPTRFLGDFMSDWSDYRTGFNYIQFTSEIVNKMGIPIIQIYPSENKKTIFHQTVPLQFDQLANNPQNIQKMEKAQALLELKTFETKEKIVKISATHPNNYFYSDSYTWSYPRDINDPNLLHIVNQLLIVDRNILNDISVIGVVYVNSHGKIGNPLPLPENSVGAGDNIAIYGMTSIDPDEEENGLVILCAIDEAHEVIIHKRTQGRVTNELGDK